MNIIVGGGKYGSYAVEFLKNEGKNFVVVDTNPVCSAVRQFGLKASPKTNVEHGYFIKGDLRSVLDLLETSKTEYVFPTVPTHLAADLAGIKFTLQPWRDGINNILPRLPQAVVLQAGKGKLVLSFNRDHQCIEKCRMPEICPSSGTKKPCTMIELMTYAAPEAFLLISHSMAPGLGALKVAELNEFFEFAKRNEKFIVGTACDCHGVFSAFQKQGLSKAGET